MGLCKKKSGEMEVTDKKDDAVRLKKEIGLIHGISIIIGVIVGSGIFVSPVGVLKNTGSVGVAMVLWVVCGLFSVLGAVCYAELGTTIPRSGGEYIYILKAFGPLPAFLCLWINFICIGAVSNAANSLIFATYVLKPMFPMCEPPEIALQLIGAVAITFLTAVNCFNVKWAAKVAVVFTASKLIALFTVIITGFVYLAKGNTEYLQNTFEGSSSSVGAYALAFYSGFWAFAGWNYLNFLVDELINPRKNLPLAIIISLAIVTVTYILANICYLTVLSPDEMLESSAVAVLFADRTLGVMAWIMPLFVAASVFGTMNSEMLSMSRVFFTGAEEGHLPVFLAMINYKWLTPAPSIIVLMIFTIAFMMSKDIFYLIELTGFTYAILICSSVAVLIYLRYKQPELTRPIKLPIGIPIFLFFWTLFIVVLTIYQQPMESLISICIFLSGIPVYWFGVSWEKKPKAFQNFIDCWTQRLQKLFMVIPQEPASITESNPEPLLE
ncbi:large neutral amino acids transporter small subunit 1-like isoform X1 [Tubulanus polymorphus]|uniref:large neutral amino acids transporter small subunit 1-like isoform X1 n=1 Tax=Tubulanus polymorphus TaxID=672921 RepID=UPI003DA25FDF